MGTDVFLYAEVRKKEGWRLLGETESNPDYFPDCKPDAQPTKPVELYDSRNYDLFGILADMRNPNGRTLNDQKFDVIAQPRGLPDDLGPEIRDWLKDWAWEESEQADYSCPSWLLLSEVLKFDWHGKVMQYEAMVDPRVAHLFEEAKPFPVRHWPEGIPVSCSRYRRDGVSVRWTSTYAESAGPDFMEAVSDLSQHGEASDIRLVFWFTH